MDKFGQTVERKKDRLDCAIWHAVEIRAFSVPRTSASQIRQPRAAGSRVMERTAADRAMTQTSNKVAVSWNMSVAVMRGAAARREPTFPIQLLADNGRKIAFDRTSGIGNPPSPAILNDAKTGV